MPAFLFLLGIICGGGFGLAFGISKVAESCIHDQGFVSLEGTFECRQVKP